MKQVSRTKKILKRVEGFFSSFKKRYITYFLLHRAGEKEIVRQYVPRTNGQCCPIGTGSPVWVCWWQGEDAMPDIAKACLNSIRKHAGGHPIRFISAHNYQEYVDIPAGIMEKQQKGIIDLTHFSDILRTLLLSRHGGIWIDCTVLLPGKSLDSFIQPSAKFWTCHHLPVYHNIARGGWTSFFWACGKQNLLAAFLADFHLHYWARQNRLIVYLLLDYAFAIARRHVPAIRQMIEDVPFTLMGPLGKCLNDEYEEEEWRHFCTDYNFHKLTYKIPLSKTTPEGKKTYYGHILENFLSA